MVHFGGWWAHHAFLHSKFSAKLGTPLPPCVHYVIYELSLSKDDSNITSLLICVFYASHFMEKKKRKCPHVHTHLFGGFCAAAAQASLPFADNVQDCGHPSSTGSFLVHCEYCVDGAGNAVFRADLASQASKQPMRVERGVAAQVEVRPRLATSPL